MRDFWSRVAATSGAQLYGLVASTAALILTANWLGPAGRGEVVAASSWAATFATLGHLSLGQVAVYSAASDGGLTRERLQPLLGTLAAAGLVVIALSLALAGGLVATDSPWLGGLSRPAFACGLLLLPGLLLEQFVNPLLVGRDRVSVYNRTQVGGRTLMLVLVSLAWINGAGPLWVLVAMAVAQAATVSTGGYVLWRDAGRHVTASLGRLRELVSGGLRLHLNYVGDFLMSSAGILMVNARAGTGETAFYQLGIQAVNIMVIVPQAAAMVYVPRIVRLGPEAGWAYQRATLALLVGGIIAMCLVAAAAVPLVVDVVFGERFATTTTVVWWLLPTVPVVTLARALAPQWLGRGLYLPVAAITLVAGIVNVVAADVLIPARGSVGAAQALALAYVPVFVAQCGMLMHCEREHRRARART